MTDMLTSMKQYNELVEEYKIKVLRYVFVLLSQLLLRPLFHFVRQKFLKVVSFWR